MNTKRVIFGILAVVTLAASSLSTVSMDDQETGIKKKKIVINRQ